MPFPFRPTRLSSGSVPAPATLKPRESVHVQLRFRMREGLPTDQRYDAHVLPTGTFADQYRGTDCAASTDADGDFGIPVK
ncbi:hypothetical protein ACH4FX_31580 [Streptomyces sp. NPDC018019]|uniref:hypothetical protein n=1 Tax=Streptomyces sp. NPDC018019 TaxID=3365030 RepID=UPI0037AEB630